MTEGRAFRANGDADPVPADSKCPDFSFGDHQRDGCSRNWERSYLVVGPAACLLTGRITGKGTDFRGFEARPDHCFRKGHGTSDAIDDR